MDLYRGVRPMLDFTSLPPRALERPRRRRKAVKTPKNARVKSVCSTQEPDDAVHLATKWVSPQFGSNGQEVATQSDASSLSQRELHQPKRTHKRMKPLDVRKLFPKENANVRRATSAGQRRTKAQKPCGNCSRQPLSGLSENTARVPTTQHPSTTVQKIDACNSLSQMVTNLSLDVTARVHDSEKLPVAEVVNDSLSRLQLTTVPTQQHVNNTTAASKRFEISKFKPPSASTPFRDPSSFTDSESEDDTNYSIQNVVPPFEMRSQVKTRDCTFATYHSNTLTRITSAPLVDLKMESTSQSKDSHPNSDTKQTSPIGTSTSLSLSHPPESHHCTGVHMEGLPGCPLAVRVNPTSSEGAVVIEESVLAKETPSYLWCTPIIEQQKHVRTIEDTFG